MRQLGYLGPAGTYSEQVAATYCPPDCRLKPFNSIEQAMRATADGTLDLCIVPIENSLEGSVNSTLDMLAHEVDLYITAEMVWPIHHQLMVSPYWTGTIEKIYSHRQALGQCRRFLEKNYPSATTVVTDSTSAAAQAALTNPDSGAIGSSRAAELYGLKILSSAIQDQAVNHTRFVRLERQVRHDLFEASKTSILCQLQHDRPGGLYELLGEFAKRSVNLSRIESRPAKTYLGTYLFFLDLAGHSQSKNIEDALVSIRPYCNHYKYFGSYPTLPLPQNTPLSSDNISL